MRKVLNSFWEENVQSICSENDHILCLDAEFDLIAHFRLHGRSVSSFQTTEFDAYRIAIQMAELIRTVEGM